MGFILDGLDTEAYDRNYTDRELLSRIISYFRPHTRQMILVAVMITLNSAAGTGSPILISKAIDMMAENPSIEALLLLAGGVLLLGATAWIFNYIRQLFSARVVGNVVLQLREDVFNATVGHDLSFFDEHPSGKIVSRVTSDTQDFSAVATLVMDLLSQVLLVVILSTWLFTINLWLTLLLLGMAPIAATVALSFRRVARTATQRARRVTAKINAQIQESVSGIMIAKSFRQEHAVYASFDANNQQAYQVGLRRGLTFMTIFPVMGLASGLGVATLIYAGGLATRGGIVSPGNWYLFMQAVGFFWWPLMNIASFWSQFQDGLSAAERVFALIDADPKVVQAATEPVEKLDGRIEFRQLMLTYTGEEIVLPDFTLEIRPKETLALVGHTGAGKSSLARLIARFYEFQGGELSIVSTSGWCRRSRSFSPAPCGTTSATAGQKRPTRRCAKRPRTSARGTGWLAWPTGWTPTWASGEPTFRWGNGNWSPWRACCSKTRPSLSWTRQPPAWTRSPRRKSRRGWKPSCATARPSSSPTACPPSRTPIASSSWITARSSKRARTTS